MAIAAVQALDTMLKSRERREQLKLSNALAMMQYAQQRKMQNYQLAGEQLKFAQVVNQQQMQSTASDFINRTGFMRHYVKTTDVDERSSAVEEFIEALTAKPGDGGYGFNPEDANRIVGAVWAYGDDGSNIRPIVQLASELKTLYDTNNQSSLALGFLQTPLFDSKEEAELLLGGSQKACENERLIAKEMYEYSKGDFEIQSDISMFELPDPEDPAPPVIPKSKKEELDSVYKTVTGRTKDYSEADENLDNLKSEKFQLERKIFNLKTHVDSGYTVSDTLLPSMNSKLIELSKEIELAESKKDSLSKSLYYADAESKIKNLGLELSQENIVNMKESMKRDTQRLIEFGRRSTGIKGY